MDDLSVANDLADIHKAGDLERDANAKANFDAFSTGLKQPNPPTNPQEVAANTRHPDTGGALRIDHWVQDLPKNVSVGLIDAAVNTGDTVRAFYHSHAANFVGQPDIPAPAEGKPAEPAPLKATKAEWDAHITGDTIYGHVRGSVMSLRNRLADGLENPEDLLTQQVSQLAIPGLGLAKLAGATASLGLANTARVAAADAVVAGTVLEPHSGRLADLAELAKHTEGRIGKVFNTLAPDGSLMNNYLNWMSDRKHESEFAGRVKNMVDSLSGSAVLAGVVNGAIGSVRYARYLTKKANAVKPIEDRATFSGTPHVFDPLPVVTE